MITAAALNLGRELNDASEMGHLARVNELLELLDVSNNQTAFDCLCALGGAARFGHLAVVNRLLQIPVISNNAEQNFNQALRWAAQGGHLAVVNRLLQIPAVSNNATEFDNDALILAAWKGHIDVVNRLLEIPDVKNNAAAEFNNALRLAANNGHLAVVNRLLEVPAVRDDAATLDNYALRKAVDNSTLLYCATYRHHFDVAYSLLNAPAVHARLESGPREAFLAFYKNILRAIKERSALRTERDKNGNITNTTYKRGPLEAEIKVVDIFRDIGRRHGISSADFTEEELAILTFARRVNDSLHFKLSTSPSLMVSLLAAPAPQPEPLPFVDPAAPATSSGTPALLEDDTPPREAMEQPAKRQRVLGSLFDCFCRRRDADLDIDSGPGEPSSSSSRKRARQD